MLADECGKKNAHKLKSNTLKKGIWQYMFITLKKNQTPWPRNSESRSFAKEISDKSINLSVNWFYQYCFITPKKEGGKM